MEALKKNKFLLYVFIGTFVIFAGYFLWSALGSSSTSGQTTQGNASNTGASILASLQELSSAQIDTSLFQSSAWTSLQNISAPIPNDAPGKADLFAPLH